VVASDTESEQIELSDIDAQNDEDDERLGSYIPPADQFAPRRRARGRSEGAALVARRRNNLQTDSDEDERSTLLQGV